MDTMLKTGKSVEHWMTQIGDGMIYNVFIVERPGSTEEWCYLYGRYNPLIDPLPSEMPPVYRFEIQCPQKEEMYSGQSFETILTALIYARRRLEMDKGLHPSVGLVRMT